MKEKHQVGLLKTCWVYSPPRYWFWSWRKVEGQGEAWNSAVAVGTFHQVTSLLPPVLPDTSPWSCEQAVQTSTKELHLLKPAVLRKQKGHFNHWLGGVKGGCRTEVSLGWGVKVFCADPVSLCPWVERESGPTAFPFPLKGLCEEESKISSFSLLNSVCRLILLSSSTQWG